MSITIAVDGTLAPTAVVRILERRELQGARRKLATPDYFVAFAIIVAI